ncbi:MAG: hypothetical protein GY862_39070 [Gammaproteobacteria bacterium]|nr:hypothetical protein [Gammaproteobacteria bacterium]
MNMNPMDFSKDDRDWLDVLSEKPVPDDACPDTIREARALNLNIKMLKLDISEPDELANLLAKLEATGHVRPEEPSSGPRDIRSKLPAKAPKLPKRTRIQTWWSNCGKWIIGSAAGFLWKNLPAGVSVVLAGFVTWSLLLQGEISALRQTEADLREEIGTLSQETQRVTPKSTNFTISYAYKHPERLAARLLEEIGKTDGKTFKLSIKASLPENLDMARSKKVNMTFHNKPRVSLNVSLPKKPSAAQYGYVNELLNKHLDRHHWGNRWRVPPGLNLDIKIWLLTPSGPAYIYKHFDSEPSRAAGKLKQAAIEAGAEAEMKPLGNGVWRVSIELPATLSEPIRGLIGEYNLNQVISSSRRVRVDIAK